MSEELRQLGYMKSDGSVNGDAVGPYESFNIGKSTFNQLSKAGLVPAKLYEKPTLRPDGIVVERTSGGPVVHLVREFKDGGGLTSEKTRESIFDKMATEYCAPLDCQIGVVSDGIVTYWLLIDTGTKTWKVIEREDGYPLDAEADLATEDGRRQLADLLNRLHTQLDHESASLVALDAVNPTRLADRTWQTIWLASGDNPETCLASFVELLLFKFLSDLGALTTDPSGSAVDFDTVRKLAADAALAHYFDKVRPEIERLFPSGADGTSVLGGLALDPANKDHGVLFLQILKQFHSFGSLRRIDPEFKSRIFERFLKKSISQKNWGQYFTPRNVVKAMVEMSGVDTLPPGAVLADPACGVGGFVLEPLVHKRSSDLRDSKTKPLTYVGLDRDAKTVGLAKANMLIHLSEVIEANPAAGSAALAPVLNATFKSMSAFITGSLAAAPEDEWDLVMTNPPYVVAGSSKQREAIANDPKLAAYYSVPGSGVENLFLQAVVKGLKPGCRALVVVPDGLLLRHSEEALRRHILEQCTLEAIVSLPKNTFYSTPKKTYILVIRKKLVAGSTQTAPVFTYLTGEVGETLDAKRFVTPEANDLPEMATQFRMFAGLPEGYAPPEGNLRVKVWPIEKFQPEVHWLVDRWWPEAELHQLPEYDAPETISPVELVERLRDVATTISDLSALVVEQGDAVQAVQTRSISLGDGKRFRLTIGKRVLKKTLFFGAQGSVPLYSANVVEPFGHLEESNLKDFSNPSVLFGIDGNFDLAMKEAEVEFAITDHCGRIEILDPELDPAYCRAAIALARAGAFDRTLRPSLKRMRSLEIQVPVRPDGSFDLDAQKSLAATYDSVTETLREAAKAFGALTGLEPDLMVPGDGAAAGGTEEEE